MGILFRNPRCDVSLENTTTSSKEKLLNEALQLAAMANVREEATRFDGQMPHSFTSVLKEAAIPFLRN